MSKFAFWKSARPQGPAQMSAPAVMLGGMLLASSAAAVELSDTVQLHGFASQAYIETTDNKYFGNSDRGTFDFRELGVNLSWQAMPTVQFAAQVGSRKAGGTEVNANPRFDYLFVDFTAVSGESGRAGIRVGRHRNALGLYNQTRDVANTRPSIFLPSWYSDQSRNLLLSLDGAQLYEEGRTAVGDFFFEFGAGNVILDSTSKNIGRAATSYVGRLLYEADGGRVRLALTGADANLDIYQQSFSDARLKLTAYILSAQYNAETWSLTGEWMPEETGTVSGIVLPFAPGVNAAVPDTVQTGESYYLQGTYRFVTDWEALLRYDVFYSNKNDRSGAAYAATTGGPAYSQFATDLTAGLAWSIRPDTKVRAEYHRVNGTAWLSARENPVAGNTRQYWDMFALQVSYSF